MRLKVTIVMLILLSSIMLFSCDKTSNIYEYLDQFENKSNIVVTDGYDMMCLNNEFINIKEHFNNYIDDNNIAYQSILYVSKKHLILKAYNKSKQMFEIYLSTHDFSEINLVYTYQKMSSIIQSQMISEDTFFYHDKDGFCYIYNFLTNKKEKVSNNYPEINDIRMKTYIVSKKINPILNNVNQFTITNKYTNKTNSIFPNDFDNIQQVKELKNKTSVNYSDICIHNEKIYIIGYVKGVTLIFNYDFLTEEITFDSWVKTINLVSEPRKYYFI